MDLLRTARRCAPLLLAACASAPPPRPAGPPPERPIARSSIDAVLLYRGELGLTPEQVETLQARDRQREKDDASIRTSRPVAVAPAASSPAPSDAQTPDTQPQVPAGMHGRGGGRHRGGGGSRAAQPGPPKIEDQLDENDTRAYLDAEAALTDAQRQRAREIAEKYREDLYTWQHAQVAADAH